MVAAAMESAIIGVVETAAGAGETIATRAGIKAVATAAATAAARNADATIAHTAITGVGGGERLLIIHQYSRLTEFKPYQNNYE